MNSSMTENTDLVALKGDLAKVIDEVKSFAEQITDDAKKGRQTQDEIKARADEALTKMNDLDARVREIEQKGARPGGPPTAPTKSLGETFVESNEFKSFLGQGPTPRGVARISVETKNITSATGTWGSGTSPSNSLIMADRRPIVNLPDRPLVVRDLITPGQTGSNAIEYPVEGSFTNNAAPVAELATKPQSDLTFDLKSTTVKTIAHWMKASRQILDDAPMLRTYIDGRLRFGLEYVEEAQILYGDGTGQNLNGIITQATAYSGAFTVTGETNIDRLRLAALQANLALYPPSGYVLHPTDLAKIEMVKDGTGQYLIGDPQGELVPRLWGLPVVASLAITAGTFLTGAFRMGAQLFDRMAIEVLISTEDQDNFVKNAITIRAEERLALAVYRPGAFITGTLL